MATCIGTASIARSKNAGQMCWQAIVAGAIRTRTLSTIPQNTGAQRNATLARSSSVTGHVVMSASLIGRSRSSVFQTIHHSSVDVARGLVGSLRNRRQRPSSMGFEDEAEQSPCRQMNGRSKRTNELTSSIVPRGDIIPALGGAQVSPLVFDPAQSSCHCCFFLGPAELGAVNPYAVRDHGQPACQRYKWSMRRFSF
jgi:hypothetical protein